ncbi:sensor histidine kinase [Patulibacter defluvii]|uniref:sensor histidine kinase n=1 Tax=Patulibacter defluvii TaxID=3095358 RepID=UPI002A760B7E|nr:ATP-binding protein [Patulibacter sp. DM4]
MGDRRVDQQRRLRRAAPAVGAARDVADPAPQATLGRGERRLIALATVATLAIAIAVAAGSTPAYAANSVQIVLTVALLVATVRFARRAGAVRPAALLLCGAWSLYLIGLCCWNASYLADLSPAAPRVWDLLYIAALPLMSLAVALLPLQRSGLPGALRLLCDGILVGAGLLMMTWSLWVDDVLDPASWSADYVIGALYTVLNHLLLGVGLVAVLRTGRAPRSALSWLTVAFGIFAAASITELAHGFGGLTFDSRWLYVPYTGVAVPLLVGTLLAARAPERVVMTVAVPGWKSLLPVVVALAGVVVELATPSEHPFPTFLLATLLVAIVAREGVAYGERRTAQRDALLEVMRVEARERQSLADELHDEVLQDLAVIRWHVDDLAEGGGTASRDAAVAGIVRAQEQIRMLLADTHPAVAEQRELRVTIARLVERQAQRTPVPIDVEVGPVGRRPVDSVLEAVARELLANAAKHARASRIGIRIVARGSEIELVVHDDGVGMPSGAHAPGPGHVGLASCAMRVAAVGGSLAIAPRPGGGTQATVVVPAAATVGPDGGATPEAGGPSSPSRSPTALRPARR